MKVHTIIGAPHHNKLVRGYQAFSIHGKPYRFRPRAGQLVKYTIPGDGERSYVVVSIRFPVVSCPSCAMYSPAICPRKGGGECILPGGHIFVNTDCVLEGL